MKKIDRIAVQAQEPFALDLLDRRPFVEMIARYVATIDQPFTIGLAAPWGSGKSVVLDMLSAHISASQGKEAPLICRFDAWSYEDVADPILTLTEVVRAEFAKHYPAGSANKLGKKLSASARSVASTLVAGAGAFGGALAAHVLGSDPTMAAGIAVASAKAAEEVAKSIPDAIADNQAKAATNIPNVRSAFRKDLSALVKAVRADTTAGGCRIFIIIDELDRCNPAFALRVFERAKHFFDQPGVVFLLSYDAKYVQSAAQAIYGANFESERYFRRFVDLEVALPDLSLRAFAEGAFRQLRFEDISSFQEASDYLLDLIETTKPRMSLRDVAQYASSLRLAAAQNWFSPVMSCVILPAIMIGRYSDSDSYHEAVRHDGPFKPFLESAARSLERTKHKQHIVALSTYARLIDLQVPEITNYMRDAGRDEDVAQHLTLITRVLNSSGKPLYSVFGASLRLLG